MASKLIVLVTVLAASNAAPLLFSGPVVYPNLILRMARSPPSFAYGFGSGFSSNIGGISHSSGIGASFQSGDAEAYGAGIGNGGNYAQGVGIANTGRGIASSDGAYPQGVVVSNTGRNRVQPTYNSYQPTYNSYQPQSNYGTSYSLAHNDGHSGTAISSAQSVRDRGYATAISSGNGYGQTAISTAQSNGNGYAVSAAENIGGFGAGTAHAVQQRGNGFQQTSATSIVQQQPSIQLAQSQAFNTGYY